MKRTFIFLTLSLILSCSTNKFNDDILIGEWNVFYIINNKKDITGNYPRKNFITKPLSIRKNGFFIIQLLDSTNTHITGKIERLDSTKIKISNSTKAKLNAIYTIYIERKIKRGSEISYMELESENNLIIAEKYEKRIISDWRKK